MRKDSGKTLSHPAVGRQAFKSALLTGRVQLNAVAVLEGGCIDVLADTSGIVRGLVGQFARSAVGLNHMGKMMKMKMSRILRCWKKHAFSAFRMTDTYAGRADGYEH